MSRALVVGLLVVGLVVFLVQARRLFGPPVAHPVTVRGGTRPQTLAAAIGDFRPDQIVSVLPREAIPAIDRPRFVSADTAHLGGTDIVIGVEIGGEARAYPVGILSGHEIVNDTIRGHPIAVTW